jgi:tRNA threonylcarbamoyl adenosine modification protein YeaZ
MNLLALEFSSEQRSVALARDGEVLASAVESGGFRVTNAFALITKVLAQSRFTREQVEGIAVGLGPGSYTGIRSAIAVAQGWQLARSVKILGVSSAEAIALRAQLEKIRGPVNVVIDAQRNELYVSTWDISDAGLRPVSGLKIISGAALADHSRAGEWCVGPDLDAQTGRRVSPDAAAIALLASHRTDFIEGQKLEPIYLRETSFVKASPPRQT